MAWLLLFPYGFPRATWEPVRNEMIALAYAQGYSQHMIAKVLGLAQSTVNGIAKRVSR
ncbi:MAG: hypothetical protein IE881_09435 [Epsilonproteobacteria bacterium]|nr:hypothetical protein [Campylobacterota bacterium]